MIRDFNVEWLEKKKWIGITEFQGYAGALLSVGVGAGAPLEISTFGIVGLPMDVADDTSTIIALPDDLDIKKQIRFRVVYTQTSTTATDAATFILLYTQIQLTDNVASVVDPAGTTLVFPATALDTAIPTLDLSSGVAYKCQATGFGVINRNTILETSSLLSINLELDAVTTYSADEVVVLGLEMRYTPRRTAGPRRNILGGRRLVDTRPLGVMLNTTQEGL